MAYILSWRRKDAHKEATEDDMFQGSELLKYLRKNPGIRWKNSLQEEDAPINYLEIGVFKGHNIIDMSKSYCKHPNSVMHCVDPWIDYDEYPEYKGKIESVYTTFVNNMESEKLWDKIKVYRDFSQNIVPTFPDNFFDIAFIDGNHETEFVYKDGEMVLPKLKSGGTIIFDDYDWPQTKLGIHKFLNKYSAQLKNIRNTPFQLFVNKL